MNSLFESGSSGIVGEPGRVQASDQLNLVKRQRKQVERGQGR